MKAIMIFDLDGCISDDSSRRHLLMRQDGFDLYHALINDDPPMNSVYFTQQLEKRKSTRLAILTARPERYREQTQQWIKRNFDLDMDEYVMLMRPNTGENANANSPDLKTRMVRSLGCSMDNIVLACDDRPDILDAYAELGIKSLVLLNADGPQEYRPRVKSQKTSVPDIMNEMAATFRERNAQYRDNWLVMAELLVLLFPNGVSREMLATPAFNILMMKLSKLTRFVASDLTHIDSIHDDAVYSAIIENILRNDKTTEVL